MASSSFRDLDNRRRNLICGALQRSRLARDPQEAASALGSTAATEGAVARTWMIPADAANPRDL